MGHEAGVLQAKEAEEVLHPLAGAIRDCAKEGRRFFSEHKREEQERQQSRDAKRRQLTQLEAVLMIERAWVNRKKKKDFVRQVRASISVRDNDSGIPGAIGSHLG